MGYLLFALAFLLAGITWAVIRKHERLVFWTGAAATAGTGFYAIFDRKPLWLVLSLFGAVGFCIVLDRAMARKTRTD
ncbi:MAG TPA: hypothetical protein VGR69_02685 [Candidatus Rubrimentiphilum sp.]|nr:hypothetical protein [Candidatus Rubrimentiphilum sp.]